MLSEDEAARRLAERGPSRVRASSRSTWSIVRANTFTLFSAILAVAGAVTLLLADWRDTLFLAILVGNTTIGIAQELRAKRELDRLAALVAPTARVVREEGEREVAVGEVVTGDLLRAGQGDQIVADGRLEPGERVVVDESILTGESEGVVKTGGDEVRSGSFVLEGTATYLASAVGEESYAERITGEARTFRHPRSPLENGLNRLLTVMVILMAPLAVVLAIGLAARDDDTHELVSTAVAALVSLVPEGLMLLASMTAAVAAVKMTRRGALVQQLNGVESLASVDLVCLDKTGTITSAELRVEDARPTAGVGRGELRAAISRLAAATPDPNLTLAALGRAFPPTGDAAGEPVRASVPFSSRRRWSAVELGDGVLVLGAPEHFALGELGETVSAATADGRRVLAIGTAAGPLAEAGPEDPPPPGVRPLGVVVLSERLRDDARETVAFLRAEGVELRILSGDAPATVGAIARDAGLDAEGRAADGASLPEDPAELAALLEEVSVVGRISPEGKRRVVESLTASGRYVAMVGDGVNDVPALKAARLAIAQGTGAQMARSVADVVLVRGDFAVLPPMVGEGRTILRNVQRVGRLFVTKSVFAAILIVAFATTGLDYPFIPRQLSLAATLTIGGPAFFLALAQSTGRWRTDGFVREIMRFAIPAGVALAAGVLLAEILSVKVFGQSTKEARTVATSALTAIGLIWVLALEKNERRTLAAVIVALMTASYLVVLFVPALRTFFDLTPVQLDMATCAVVGTLVASAIFLPVWWRIDRPQAGETMSSSRSRSDAALQAPTDART